MPLASVRSKACSQAGSWCERKRLVGTGCVGVGLLATALFLRGRRLLTVSSDPGTAGWNCCFADSDSVFGTGESGDATEISVDRFSVSLEISSAMSLEFLM